VFYQKIIHYLNMTPFWGGATRLLPPKF